MRLFVAIQPPGPVIERLAALVRPDAEGVRWTPRENLHVTLRFLGEVAEADTVLGRLRTADLGPPVEAVIGPATAWMSRNILAVPVAGIDDLAGRVIAATADLGASPDDRAFRGHVTLARRRRSGRRPAAGVAISARFPVTEVVVFASELRHTGAVHQPIARLPLHE